MTILIQSVRCLRRISDRRLLATTWHPATAATSPKQTEEIHSHILQAKSNDFTDTSPFLCGSYRLSLKRLRIILSAGPTKVRAS